MNNKEQELKMEIKLFKNCINAAEIKMFLSKIAIGSIAFLSILAGFVLGHIGHELTKWLILSIGTGAIASVTPLIIHSEAANMFKKNQEKLNILKKEQTDIKSEQQLNHNLTKENTKTPNINKQNIKYSYNPNNITDENMDDMINMFKELKEKDNNTQKKR